MILNCTTTLVTENVVADALSRKSMSVVASLAIREWKMLGDLNEFDVRLGEPPSQATLFSILAQPTLITRVLKAQQNDPKVEAIKEKILQGKEEKGLKVHSDLSIRYVDRLFVPQSYRDDVL